jgi:benzodiazapine receptor
MYKKPITTSLSDGWIGLIIAVSLCQAAGLVGLFLSGSTGKSSWYRILRKPGFTTPPKVFGPAWGILYLLMGIALHILWRKRSNPGAASALRLFGGQLLLNAS